MLHPTLRVFIFLFCVVIYDVPPIVAAEKIFSGQGDGSTWHDGKNWFEEGVPSSGDAVTIDRTDVLATVGKDFLAQSVTVGGKAASRWTVNSFIYGTVSPPASIDPALLIRKDGTVALKGAGTVVLKGPLKNSEESLPGEPSVMILLE